MRVMSDGPDGLPDLERARADADRRYNDALTTVDRSIVRGGAPLPPVALDSEVTLEPAPGRPRRWLRRLQEWLAPVFDRQQSFNRRVAGAFDAQAARDHERA